MAFKEYFAKELQLREQEIDLAFELYMKHHIGQAGTEPMAQFRILYQFSSVGVGKIMEIEGKEFPLNEDEWI